MTLTAEIATRQSGSARYFCGIDFLTDDNQTYGGTFAESPGERDELGIWHGSYINEFGPSGGILAYKTFWNGKWVGDERLGDGLWYTHTVTWRPDSRSWFVSVGRKSLTVDIQKQMNWQIKHRPDLSQATFPRWFPYEPMHVGLYGLTPGVCFYRNLGVTGVRA